MTDDASTAGEPSKPTSDPFVSAKENIRETVKWLATSLAALASVILAGTSVRGISAVGGDRLIAALVFGGAGLVCVLFAIGVTLSLITSESFFLSDIREYPEIVKKLNQKQKSADVLPPEFLTIDDLLKERTKAIEDIRAHMSAPTSQEYRDASAFYKGIEAPVSRLLNLLHFEVLQARFKRQRLVLFLLALGALIGIGGFAVFTGAANAERADQAVANLAAPSLSAAQSWTELSVALGRLCAGAGPVTIQVVAAPRAGWTQMQLLSPQSCAGASLIIPTGVIAIPNRAPTITSAGR